MLKIFLLFIVFAPIHVCFAQTVDTILQMLIGQLDNIALVGIGFAVVVFVWGIVQMMFGMSGTGSAGENAREIGKKRMIYGVVSLFVIMSIWGIVSILINVFGVGSISPIHVAPYINY